MKVHFIAIGGSAMHNLALALYENGHEVTGSDDEIYDPALSRLSAKGLSPIEFGWFPSKITKELDAIILGMHAKLDNPELLKAQELGLKIYSYPEFVYERSKTKKRVVIAGSHGKTTTTSIVLHVLKHLDYDFDYLVGSQIEGFDLMVRLSDAPLIIIEGDEYLSSPIDRRPKIMHYKPHVSVITGIAWDHINVFPTFENYIEQFDTYIGMHESSDMIFYYAQDVNLKSLVENNNERCHFESYDYLELTSDKKILFDGKSYYFPLVGFHNQQNAEAARKICNNLGVQDHDFFAALESFTGAAKRLQVIHQDDNYTAYLDFAHAPSKVKATTDAIKEWYPNKTIIAVFELHTFSSLNKEFLPTYKNCLDGADKAIVYYNEHTLKMKNMHDLNPKLVKGYFDHPSIIVCNDESSLKNEIETMERNNSVILFMSSGNFSNLKLV